MSYIYSEGVQSTGIAHAAQVNSVLAMQQAYCISDCFHKPDEGRCYNFDEVYTDKRTEF